MTNHLQHFFQLCNPDGSRSVDREAFRGLCDRFNIPTKDADVIFDDLDHDQDGKISFEDFSRGFSDFMGHQATENDSFAKGPNGEGALEEEPDEARELLTKQHIWATLTSEAGRAGSTDGDESRFKWLLEELQTTDKKYLVSCLETALEDLLKNMQQLQEEKNQLEQSWKREKHEHEKHLKRMEEEMDSQVKETEMKMRIKAQAEVEDERRSLQSKMDHETDNLQAYFKLVEKVNLWMESQPPDSHDVRLDEVRKRLDDAVHENRQLRMSLMDTQTSIALMRSELLQLRTLYEEKCRELSSEREKILEVLHEQDHLSRQLNLLHDVNKRLQDTNDALRNSIDRPNAPSKREHQSSLCRGKSGSILGDYFGAAYTDPTVDRFIDSEEDADDERNDIPKTFLRRTRSMDVNFPYSRKTKSTEKRLARRNLNCSDSGVSTTQDQEEDYSSTPDSSLVIKVNKKSDCLEEVEIESTQPKRPISMPIENSTQILQNGAQNSPQNVSKTNLDIKNCEIESKDEGLPSNDCELPRRKISDIIKQLGIQDEPVKTWTPKRQKPLSASPIHISRESEAKVVKSATRESTSKLSTSSDAEPNINPSPTPQPRKSLQRKVQSTKEKRAENSVNGGGYYRRISRTLSISSGTVEGNSSINGSVILEDSEDPFEPNGPPEHTFKVILVGDAGVGKSSFALRINKGVFVRHTSSTLSVDFLMRTIRVDGRNVSVQLWDTAGQERFRSITKSYFRNSDGVMLLYDCTCEYSFLNVRQWVEDVDGLTNHRIPLMIVANKTDLRATALKLGKKCISTAEGEKLALACDTTFIEASAKNGSNVLQALANLVRSMSNHKDLQMSASTMQLSDEKTKKSSCCGR